MKTHEQWLAELTGTNAGDWEEADGPDTRVGVDYYYSHAGGHYARINNDQGFESVTVFNIEGDEVADDCRGDVE